MMSRGGGRCTPIILHHLRIDEIQDSAPEVQISDRRFTDLVYRGIASTRTAFSASVSLNSASFASDDAIALSFFTPFTVKNYPLFLAMRA